MQKGINVRKDIENSQESNDLYALQQTPLVNFLNDSELEMLVKYNQRLVFPENHILLHQGKVADGIYLILTGAVEINARIMGEGATKITIAGPGSFIGEISFIEGGPCTTTAVSLHEVTCLFLPHLFFEFLSNYYPNLRYNILQALAEQILIRLKITHDNVSEFISETAMMNQSFFGKVMHTLNQPKEINSNDKAHYPFFRDTLFAHLTPAEMDYFYQHVTFYDAPKNCVLIHENEKSASCYAVIRGAVQSSIMRNNKVAKLSVIGPRSLFAGIACIDKNSDFTITFTTCEPSILLKINEKNLQLFQKENISLWYKLFDLITASLVALRKSIDKLDVRLHIETYNR